MAMVVTLVKGAVPDNRQHQGLYTSATAQTTYFDSLEKIQRICRTVPLGDDILFTGSIEDVRDKTYGWIDYGDGFRYYFSVYDYDFATTDSTYILYKIDIYETYLFHGMTFGRAALERQAVDIGRPMMAIGYDNQILTNFSSSNFRGGAVALGGWSSSGNELMTSICNFYCNELGIDYPWLYFFTGQAHEFLWSYSNNDWTTTPGDLKHAVLYPDSIQFYNISSGMTYLHRSRYETEGFPNTGVQMIQNDRLDNVPDALYFYKDYSTPITLSSTRTGWDELRDMRGNTIFKPNFGETWEIIGRQYQVTLSGSMMLLQMRKGDETFWLPMPGESLDSMVDTWKEYDYRQRETDIQMRSLSNQRQLVQGLSNAGTAGMEGAIGGKFAGLGAGLGAAAGVISSIVGSVANYAANEYLFDPKEQSIIDAQMKKATDAVNFYGTAAAAANSVINGAVLQGVYSFRMNTSDLINNDIAINGYPVDYRGQMPALQAGAWKGAVEVFGLPGAWKDQVSNRFKEGVVFAQLG